MSPQRLTGRLDSPTITSKIFVIHKFDRLTSLYKSIERQREKTENPQNENNMAGKLKPGQVYHLICIFSVVFFLFVFSVNVSSEADSQGAVPPEDKKTTVWLSKIKQSGNNYWGKLRETLGRGHARFFPPNVE